MNEPIKNENTENIENIENVESTESTKNVNKEKKNNKKWLLLLLLLLFLCMFGYLVFRVGLSVGKKYKQVAVEPTPVRTIIKITDADGEWGKGTTTNVVKIEINPGSLSLVPGESEKIFALTTSDKPITWTSSDDSCVTVSPREGANPTVTAGEKTCTAVIIARVGDTTAQIVVTVVPKHDDLTGIKLNQSNYEVYIGKSVLASVTVLPSTAKLPKLIYKIEDTSIATVDENGVIRGVSEGTTKLIVTTADGSYTSTATVTVKKETGRGDRIEINPGSLSLEPKESEEIFANTTSTKPITWTSSDESCVTVSPQGSNPTVTAGEKTCTAVITARSGDATAEIVVTVVPKHDDLKGIKLNQSNYEVYIGKSVLASVTVLPSTAKLPELIYRIEDTSIATVDENGVIRGVSEGTTKLIVTTADGSYTSTATVTVKKETGRGDRIEINPGSLTLETGESEEIFANTTSTKPITWTSSDESCVTVSPKQGQKPTVTAKNKECTAVITARSGDATAEIVVTVVDKYDDLKGIKLNQSNYEVYIGKSVLASVTVLPSTAKLPELIYRIEDTSIATVDENGVIRGISEGTTKLIVTTADGSYTSTATVTVKKETGRGDRIEINPGSLTLETGESEEIFANTTSTKPITWTSSDESCVTVSPKQGQKPKVTAKNKECTAVITARSGDATAEIVVTVVDKYDDLKGIKLNQSNYEVYIGKSVLASVTVLPSTAKLPELIYKIEDTSIATVDENGVIRGVSEGTTKLIVTTADGSYTSTATVTVKKQTIDDSEEINHINVFSDVFSSRGYVAPDDRGTYEFDIENTISRNIIYSLSLDEDNEHKVNIKYKLKKNGEYIIGKDGWVYYNEIKLQDVKLAAKESDSFTLEWSWVGDNNELDTKIGLLKERAEYILNIIVIAYEDVEG